MASPSPPPLNDDHNRALAWLPCSAYLSSETNAEISVFCVRCPREEALSQRGWQGRLLGKGIYGSINAFIFRAKYKVGLNSPLMALYTICNVCCEYFELDEESDQIKQIRSFKDEVKVSGNMKFGATYEEIDELVCTKLIVIEGKSTKSLKTFGADGVGKEWAAAKLN